MYFIIIMNYLHLNIVTGIIMKNKIFFKKQEIIYNIYFI